MKSKTPHLTDEYASIIERIKLYPNYSKFKCVLGIEKNGDLVAKIVSEKLGLKLIDKDNLFSYKVEEVLVVFENINFEWKKYEQHGYIAYSLYY